MADHRTLHRTLTRQQAVDLILAQRDLEEQDVEKKVVLLRADLNTPLDKKTLKITDDTRIRAVLPTIQTLSRGGGKVLVASHLGRPEPGKQSWEEMKANFSLAPVAAELKVCLGNAFAGLADDCIGAAVEARIAGMRFGQVLLLENTRFHAGDADNDDDFARALCKGVDVFVNDAFGCVHRDQASVTGVTKFAPRSLPGPLIQKEVMNLAQNIDNPKRPFAVVLGGAKVVDKIHIIDILIDKADKIIIGGKMAFTFLAAKGVPVGATYVEEKHRVEVLYAGNARTGTSKTCDPEALAMESKAAMLKKEFYLPIDQITATALEEGVSTSRVWTMEFGSGKAVIAEGYMGGDIGPATSQLFTDALSDCNTIFWNRPMGKFEVPEFTHGTAAIAKAMAAATMRGAKTIVGGGDSVSAVRAAGLSDANFTHISTGGGAALELIEGNKMPGLRALTLGALTSNPPFSVPARSTRQPVAQSPEHRG